MDGPAATGPNAPAPAPAASGGDWRAHQDMEERRSRMVNSIMEDLKKLAPVPVPESALQKIAQQFEEKIFTDAINESDYLRKIVLQMHSMESRMKAQKKPRGNAQVIQNQKPPGPAPGFPPRRDSSADRLCQGAPIPPQIQCSPQAAEALVNHTCPVPVNWTPPMVADRVLLSSPPPAPSSLANPDGSVSSGGDENLCPAPGFPPRGDSSADRLCQGALIPPQIHCSPQAAEALVNHTCPVPVNWTPPMVAARVLLSSPPPAPSSLANPAASVSSGGDENLCLGELMLDIPEDLFNDLGFAVSDELFNPDEFAVPDEVFNPDEFFNDLDFPDAAAVMADPTLPEQEATAVSTPPFVMVPTPPPAAPAPALPHL